MTDDISPDARSELNRVLDEVFSSVQEERDVVVPASVRTFMQSIVEESMTLRRSEWEEVVGLDPLEGPSEFEEGVRQADQTVYEVLRNVRADEGSYVSLIGVVETIHEEWCGIYPICRRFEGAR
jgi:hypothetical protein